MNHGQAPPDSGEPEERRRPHGHTISGHDNREIQVVTAGNIFQNFRFKEIHPHTDQMSGDRFLHIPLNPIVAVSDNNPKINGHLALIRADGGEASLVLPYKLVR